MRPLLLALLISVAVGLASSAGEPKALCGDLIVFHAGSLSVPFKAIADAFQEEHPGVRVLLEAAGSRACARKIADLGRPCDVFGSADYAVIDTLLIPDHADWCIRFATNEMSIVYSEASRRSDEITAANCFEILLLEDVAYGRSDPDLDPCGYRTVLTAKLAEQYYRRPGLAEELLAKDQRHIRPKETELLALLEAEAIDYIFLYRSVAQQHGLKCLLLPDAVNLKRPELTSHYKSVSVELTGKTPAETVTRYGEPMVYGVTIPHRTANPGAALAFVRFLLEQDRGRAIMESNGQPSVIPAVTPSYGRIPEALKQFAAAP